MKNELMKQGRSSLLSFTLLLFAVVFVQNTANAESSDSSDGDSITVCDGEDAFFRWPCDAAFDNAKVMTLTFNGLNAKGHFMASVDNTGRVNISEKYSGRVAARGIKGVDLQDVGILDSGIYLTTAALSNGTVLKRSFSLHVQVPLLLMGNELSVSVLYSRPRCQRITCGTVSFSGFPAVQFHWKTPGSSEWRVNSSAGTSRVEGCPLPPGNYTCQVAGPALTCASYLPASASAAGALSASVLLGGDAGEVKESKAEEETLKERILVIVIPIVVTATPLLCLGVWVISHMMSGYNCCSDRDVEESPSTSQLLPSLSSSGLPPCPSPADMERSTPSSSPATQAGGEDTHTPQEEQQEDEDTQQIDLEYEETADPTEPLMESASDQFLDFLDADDGSQTKL